MTKKAVYIYMAATCAMAVVTPGRLAMSLFISLELILLALIGTLFRAFLKVVKIKELKSTALCTCLISVTIAYKLLLSIFYPVQALQLSFILFLPTVSTFSSVFLFDEKNLTLVEELKNNMVPALIFSVIIIIISTIRDILGFGTISFPEKGVIKEIVIFSSDKITAGSFLATIPGAILLCAVFLSLYLRIEKKAIIMEKSGEF